MKKYINTIIIPFKQLKIFNAIFSFLFTIMMVFSRHVEMGGEENSLDNVFFTDLSIMDMLMGIVLFVLFYTIVNNLPKIRKSNVYGEVNQKSIKVFIGIFATILICWLPYVFSYWPGGIYHDTMNSLWIATGDMSMNTHEPVLYTWLWCIIFKITGGTLEPGHYIGLYTFQIMQYAGLAYMLASFVYWNWKRGLKKSLTTISTLIFAVFPLFPYWAISLWKDTVFGIVVFLFSWHLFCMLERLDNSEKLCTADLIKYISLSVLTVFARNNGIYVVILTSIIATLCVLKKKAAFRKIGISSIVVVVVCLIIQHPVFDSMGYNIDTVVESAAIPLQQTAYIISTDGHVDEESMVVMDTIMPMDKWRETYNPVNVDVIKFAPEFDREYFAENFGDFFKAYLRLCIKNPVKAVKAYLLATVDFWDVWESSGVAYISYECGAYTGIFQGDYFAYYTKIPFGELMLPNHYLSPAIFVWIMLFAIFKILGAKNKRYVLPVIPALGVWITVMIAVPLAFSFRYVFAVFLCLPIYLVAMISGEKYEEDNKI